MTGLEDATDVEFGHVIGVVGKGDGLTARQAAIFRFIVWYKIHFDFWPSFREIMEKFGFKSTHAMTCHLSALAKKGRLVREANSARSFTTPGFRWLPIRSK